MAIRVRVHSFCFTSHSSMLIQSELSTAALTISTRCFVNSGLKRLFLPYATWTGDINPPTIWIFKSGCPTWKKSLPVSKIRVCIMVGGEYDPQASKTAGVWSDFHSWRGTNLVMSISNEILSLSSPAAGTNARDILHNFFQSRFSSSSATLAEMRLNRTLMERSIKLSVCS